MLLKQLTLVLLFFNFGCSDIDSTRLDEGLRRTGEDLRKTGEVSGGTSLESILKALRNSNPQLEGSTYQYSTKNSLPANWIIQSSPNDKGSSLLTNITNIFETYVKQAPNDVHYIDILQLGNDRVNDEFQLDMIKSIVSFTNTAKKDVVIRYLEGNPTVSKGINSDKYYYFFNELMKASYTGKSNVTVYAATFDYPWVDVVSGMLPGSWNHSKIIAVDGKVSIVGGQNYWSDYLNTPPHDLSIRVNGAATASSHQFANYLWAYVAKPDTKSTTHRTVKLGTSLVTQDLPPAFNSKYFPSPATGNIPILAVGNLGIWGAKESFSLALEVLSAERVYPKNTSQTNMNAKNILLRYPFASVDFLESKAKQASITARTLLLNSVRTNGHIRISQQKIADTDITSKTNYVLWPGGFTDAIVNAMVNKNANVDILVSNDDGGAGGYGDDMGGLALKGVIIDLMTKKIGDVTKANALASKLLMIKQTPGRNEGIEPTYNHSKTWIVDDSVFYIGSDNIYPGYIQEFGYIIGDQATCSQFIAKYWNEIWSIGVAPTNL